MKTRIPHSLDFATARKAANAAYDAYRERFANYSPRIDWASDKDARLSFNALGHELTANLEILPDAITVDMDVPLMLRPFKSKAVAIVEERVAFWVEKARKGELS